MLFQRVDINYGTEIIRKLEEDGSPKFELVTTVLIKNDQHNHSRVIQESAVTAGTFI